VTDAAEGIALATEHYNEPEPVNLGSGQEITIRELAEQICDLCAFRGKLLWDATKPDGQPRRCLDTSRAERAFGFKAHTSFSDGLIETIAWYEKHRQKDAERSASARRGSPDPAETADRRSPV
jgi:GDP-L-fucose synthase